MTTRDHLETIAEDLRDPEFALEYLEMAWEDGLPNFLIALRDVVTVTVSMTRMAEATGMSRESLYKTLSATGNPQMVTIKKIMEVLGFGFGPRNNFAVSQASEVTPAEMEPKPSAA